MDLAKHLLKCDQMAEALHFSLPLERLHPACNALAQYLAGDESGKIEGAYAENIGW
jgi:hypothetical protein